MRRYMPSIPAMPSMHFGNNSPHDPQPQTQPNHSTPPQTPTRPDSDEHRQPHTTNDSETHAHRTSYLPSVPALPSVRKYLFAGGTASAQHTTHESRRRHSGGASTHEPAASSNARAENKAPTSLPELSNMVDGTFGPIGNPNQHVVKRLGQDRLVDILHAGAQERERLLLQFLRARHHNAREAFLMMKNALQWRRTVSIENFLAHSGTNLIKPSACFPMHIISNPNSCKQPVVYGLIRLLDKKKAERVPFQNALLSFLESVYFGETYVLDEMIVILDFREWSIRRNAPYRLVKDGIQMLQDYYPERLGRVFLVNYPTTIRAAYTAISPIIDAGAKEKIVWIGDADPSTTLRKYVSPKSIPSFLGGELEASFPSTWPDIAAEFGGNLQKSWV